MLQLYNEMRESINLMDGFSLLFRIIPNHRTVCVYNGFIFPVITVLFRGCLVLALKSLIAVPSHDPLHSVQVQVLGCEYCSPIA